MRAREQRVDIGPDRVERDIAKIEQTREADHDIQAEREQHVEHREIQDAHPARADLGQHERQQDERERHHRNARARTRDALDAPGAAHARSPTRSPSRPEGRNTSTRISTMKANTS